MKIVIKEYTLIENLRRLNHVVDAVSQSRQIENEYGNIYSSYGAPGKKYIQLCASMAESLGVGVPWIMCQQADAPVPMINTCNGFYCHDFTPTNPNTPKVWTENWTGWFKAWGGSDPHRPAEDVAFAVARFFQTGGTLQNYYMEFKEEKEIQVGTAIPLPPPIPPRLLSALGDITAGPAFRFAQWLESVRKRSGQYRSGFPNRPPKFETMSLGSFPLGLQWRKCDNHSQKEAAAVIKISSSKMATQSERFGYELAKWLGVCIPQATKVGSFEATSCGH